MAPTDLTVLPAPASLRADVDGIDAKAYIHGHTITVHQRWLRTELAAHDLDQDSLLGPTISRGDLFALAEAATLDGAGALRLLWNTLAWGTGTRTRHGRNRIRAIAADADGFGALLATAARKARTEPEAAYNLLRPGDRANAISYLGPSFFTKYLYFAGAGNPAHPCHILDERVARSLQHAGWSSLPDQFWSASAYRRYNELLHRWSTEVGAPRSDVIERWLFDHTSSSATARTRS